MMKRENCLNHRLDGLKDFTEKKSVTSEQSVQIRDSDNKQGWEIKKLGEVCENLDSKRIPITQSKRTKGDIPYYGASGIVDYVSDYIFDEDLLCVSEDGANLLARTYPIAFSISGKTWVNNHAHVLRFKNFSTQKFVELYLNSIRVDDYVSGMAQPKLNQAMLNKIPTPLPPLPEQQRIVSILDEAFAAIAKAKGNAEQNLKNAKELFESYLQGVFEKKGDGWEEKKLGEVVNKIMTGPFGSMLHQSDYVEEGIPVVNPQNIVDGKIIPLSKTMINQDTFSRLAKYALILGDIVIARRGEMGRCAVVRQENVNWLCGTGSFVIRVNPKKSDSNFLNVILSSNSVKQQLEKSSIGATMSNLNQTILSELPIRIPPLKAQQTIVRQLDALRAETQKLEAVYQKKIDDLEELKKSILQKAFAGELKTEKAWTI